MPPLSRSDILFFYSVPLTADEIDGFVAHLFDRGVPTARPDAVPLPFSSENPPPPPLVRVLFFLNLSQINYLILSSEHDLYPPHHVDVDLSDNTGEDRKQTAGDDVEGPGIPLIEPISSIPIRSNMAVPVRPPAADRPVSAGPFSGGQKQKRVRLASKHKTTTSSDQVITEPPSYHGSHTRLTLVSVNLVFGCLFEAFQHISQAIRTDAVAGADIQPAKKPQAPSMRKILAPKYVIILACIFLLATPVYLF
jgi:hypothetical protein